MNRKEIISEYLHFSRRERIAVLALTIIIAALFFIPYALPRNSLTDQFNRDTAWIAAIDKLEKAEPDDNSKMYEKKERGYDRHQNSNEWSSNNKKNFSPFYFDPNTVDEDGWKKLGLRDKTILTIQNFLNKGGRFHKAEDLQKIYGLFPDEYERIATYIQIANNSSPSAHKSPNEIIPVKKSFTSGYSILDINLADTSAFVALPGIGSKLANRIVSFREKLGGFYKVEQVAETFGLTDSVFQKIKQYLKIENAVIRKININTATVDELKSHPYIRYTLANPIVAYRKEHGLFVKPEDLKNVMAVTEEVYLKVLPYLKVE